MIDKLLALIRPLPDPEGTTKRTLYIVGILLTPITLGGALWGYIRCYNRYYRKREQYPNLQPLDPIQKWAMVAFALLVWLIIYGIIVFAVLAFENSKYGPNAIFIYLIVNSVVTIVSMRLFDIWRDKVMAEIMESKRFGTAKFADDEEIEHLKQNDGLYIGGGNFYSKQGHLITVGGTRGGKGTNLIIPNLLGIGKYSGSWVVIDPKGENAAITARYQKSIGQEVIVLDPWKINGDGATYNPLDLLKDSKALADDAGIIAEMIVPEEEKGDRFFTDRARSLITAMIIYLIEKGDDQLTTVWRWLRLKKDDWADLLADMSVSDNEIVSGAANELLTIMETADRTYGSIVATAQQATDFLKSPAVQESMKKSNFNINNLSKGKTTLYVIIPADKLSSQSRWLRLVVTTSLRAVVRNKDKRVTFLLDELAALGYLPEIETALSTYAGYNVTIWAILQSLIQLSDKYGKNWETFLGNTAVKHFFSLGDNFTLDYVSKSFGNRTFQGFTGTNSTSRPLITADELRRASSSNIFAVIDQLPPTYFRKQAYYEMADLNGKYDKNPYFN